MEDSNFSKVMWIRKTEYSREAANEESTNWRERTDRSKRLNWHDRRIPASNK